MNTKFTLSTRDLYRICCTALAALLVVAGLPILQSKPAYAAQFFQRSIQLSDAGFSSNSVVPTGIGSGTGVTYRVSFTAVNPGASLIIDFCSNNPIINDTCTAPAGMVATAATLNAAQITGNIYGGNGWSVTASSSQVRLANSGNASQDISAGAQVFELSGITNPNFAGSYYARMYSYQNNSYGAYASPTSTANSQSPATGGIVDYGGIALSTSNTITITARVQETLTFCVTRANPTSWTTTNDCSDPVVGLAANYPALTLGHNAGTGTPVLDPSQVDTSTIYSQLSTNANSGAVINMRNSNFTCGGLSADNNTTCAIPAVPDGNGGSAGYQAGPIVAGTAAFGVFVSQGVANANGGTGTLVASPAYHDPAHTTFPTDLYYGMDSTTATGPGAVPATVAGSVRSTYGSTVASTTTPISRVENTYIFGAAASLTTPAGIYTANLSMVATGTF